MQLDSAYSLQAFRRGSAWLGFLVAAMPTAFGAVPVSGLAWGRTEAVVRPPAVLPVVTTEFPFRNTGAVPITVVSLVSLCGCLKATMEKATYLPGESGAVRVAVPVAAAKETAPQAVRVTTDDGAIAVLRVILDVPSRVAATPLKPASAQGETAVAKSPEKKTPASAAPVTLRSHLVIWRMGEAPVEKAIDILVAPGFQPAFGELRLSGAGFKAGFESSPDGEKRRIMISPISTEKPVAATVRLDVVVNGVKRVYSARVVVE